MRDLSRRLEREFEGHSGDPGAEVYEDEFVIIQCSFEQ